MFIQSFKLIVPHSAQLVTHALAADPASGEHDKIQAYQGTQAVKNYGISVTGSGSKASGTISGSLTTYDYKAIYSLYTLSESESAQYWFVNYSKDSSHDELQKTFEHSETLTTNYHVDFTIQGNDYGQNSVFITFEVIRLSIAGVTKDFVVTNPASSGANNSDGSTYQGQFTAK
jgi:hypothetical protein